MASWKTNEAPFKFVRLEVNAFSAVNGDQATTLTFDTFHCELMVLSCSEIKPNIILKHYHTNMTF